MFHESWDQWLKQLYEKQGAFTDDTIGPHKTMIKTLKQINLPAKYSEGKFDINDNTLLKPKYYQDPINCEIMPTNAN